MSTNGMPTRRDVVSGAIGLAAAGLYPRGLQGGQASGVDAQNRYEPYRYAGRSWWEGHFNLAGVRHEGTLANPDSIPAGERGWENYRSIEFLRAAEATGFQSGDPLPLPLSLPAETFWMFHRNDPALMEVTEVLNRWAQDMTCWAKAVREDILRIEDHLGLPHGDPGDPPPPPWK